MVFHEVKDFYKSHKKQFVAFKHKAIVPLKCFMEDYKNLTHYL